VLRIFTVFNIPHYVCGGFAVQEHGYPRFTVDVDIIVPDVEFAMEKLSLNGFKANPGSRMTVTDRETNVEIDLLPAGKKRARLSHQVSSRGAREDGGYEAREAQRAEAYLNSTSSTVSKRNEVDAPYRAPQQKAGEKGGPDPGPLTLPVPDRVSDTPQILCLEKLISSKLSTYIGRGIDRAQDYADVVKLIQANHPAARLWG
jgi:hypothetical protein